MISGYCLKIDRNRFRLLHSHDRGHRFDPGPEVGQADVLVFGMLVVVMICDRDRDRVGMQVFFEQIERERAAAGRLQYYGIGGRGLQSRAYPPDDGQVHGRSLGVIGANSGQNLYDLRVFGAFRICWIVIEDGETLRRI